MIHLIYIYFIINALLAGIAIGCDEKPWMIIIAALFGCLYPLLYLISIAGWIDRQLELHTLFVLYFTNGFKKVATPEGISALKRAYPKANWYRKWVLRQIDRKYGYGIVPVDNDQELEEEDV